MIRSPATATACAMVKRSSTVMILPFERMRSTWGCCACRKDRPPSTNRPTTTDLLLLPCLRRTVSVGSRCRPSKKQRPPVGKRDVPADRLIRQVLGLKAIDDDLGSRWQRVLRKAESVESVRATTFDRPRDHFTVGPLHVDVDPRVRIGHLPFGDGPPQLERAVDVEFRRERMMSRH